MKGAQQLHDCLLASGWIKILARAPGAYERHGDRFLTWKRDGVLIASSGSTKWYHEDRNSVLIGIGNGDEVTIEALVTEEALRGNGLARSALREWLDLSAQAGVKLYLEPVPLEDGISRDSLIAFYTSMGFRPQDQGHRVLVTSGDTAGG